MNFRPVWAVVLRHFRLLRHDLNRLSMVFYWPILDVFIWGFVGKWVQQNQPGTAGLSAIFLIGILLWQITSRTSFELSFILLEELWSENLINIFSSPLRLSQWLLGGVLFVSLVISTILVYCVGLVSFFYAASVITIIKAFLIFGPPLFLSGLWLGFTSLLITIYFGKRAQELTFILGWFFSPFSGAFYPIEVLPTWAQAIARVLPMSYVFEGMRNYIIHQKSPVPFLLKSGLLSAMYASIALLLFISAFSKSKEKGLTRLID